MKEIVNRGRLHGRATVWAIIGSVAVFGGVVLVNQLASAPDPAARQASAPIEMVRRLPPPPKPKPQEAPKAKPRTVKAPPPPPLSGLTSGLSGVDLGMNLGLWDFGAVDDALLGDNGDVVMTSETVDVPPRPKLRSPLPYPAGARAQGQEGYVLVSLLIGKGGEVQDARVVEAQPAGVFDEVVLSSIRAWQFAPAEYKGERVKVWANQRVRFDLG